MTTSNDGQDSCTIVALVTETRSTRHRASDPQYTQLPRLALSPCFCRFEDQGDEGVAARKTQNPDANCRVSGHWPSPCWCKLGVLVSWWRLARICESGSVGAGGHGHGAPCDSRGSLELDRNYCCFSVLSLYMC